MKGESIMKNGVNKDDKKKKQDCARKKYGDKKEKMQNGKPNPGKDREYDANSDREYSRDYNDPVWRQYSDLLASQVNSFSLNQIVGTAPEWRSGLNAIKITTPYGPSVIGRVDLAPGAGYSKDANAAINQVGLKTFTDMTANNMRTIKYGPQDVTICLLALNSVLSTAAFIRRAFGVMGTVSPRNYVFPRALFEQGMLLDYDDMLSNLANYRAQYNMIAATASSIAFPMNFDAFKTTIALYSDLFQDHSSDMAQTWVTYPAINWTLDEASDPKGSVLLSHSAIPTTPGRLVTMDVWLETLRQQIGALMNSATLQEMYPDVLKYAMNFGATLFSLAPVADDYSVLPVYSEEFCIQLENHVALGEPVTKHGLTGYTDGNNVTSDPDNNAIVYAPLFKMPDAYSHETSGGGIQIDPFVDPLLNFHIDNPDVNTRTIATRFKAVAMDVMKQGNGHVFSASVSDWYVVNLSIFQRKATGYVGDTLANIYKQDNTYMLTQFAHPPVSTFARNVSWSGDTVTFDAVGVFGELDKWTTVDMPTIRTINDVATMSLFSFKKAMVKTATK